MPLQPPLRLTEATTAHSENASLNTAAMKRVALTAAAGVFVQISLENTESVNLYVASGAIFCFPAVATDTAGARTYSAAATVETAALAEITAGRYWVIASQGTLSDIPVTGLAKLGKGLAVKSMGTGSTPASTNALGMTYMRLTR